MSQGEIDRTSEGFVDAVFEFGQDIAARPSTLHRSDYLEPALAGRAGRATSAVRMVECQEE
ncbi:MAG: hypothetical protein ACR2G2_04150 [Pseudonocardia sp.]